MVKGFRDAMKDMDNGVYDFTENGRCIECGSCCSNILPMSKRETEVIRNYIKRYNIKPYENKMPLKDRPYDMNCPFCDNDKHEHKCRIYEVRPYICRTFMCNKKKYDALNDNELTSEIRTPCFVREFFYGGNTDMMGVIEEIMGYRGIV